MSTESPEHASRAAEELRQGRAAIERKAWAQAYEHLSAADAVAPLHPLDLEQLATAAFLVGETDPSLKLWARAFDQHAHRRDAPRAARCAFWIVLELLNVREQAQASGWLVRAQRLLDTGDHDCPERGLLLVLAARLQAMQGAALEASATAATAAAAGERFDDPDLQAFGRLILAELQAVAGHTASATALFDEIMVAVTVGEVSPVAVGTLYCAVIAGCHAFSDIARAREWTAALSRWCSAQPELVRFRGQCLVHRAEILRLTGEWSEAAREAAEACASANLDDPALGRFVGAAFYELAEIHRVRGDFSAAEEAYRKAAQCGRSPEPGLALLRLAQNRPDVAVASIRRVIGERLDQTARARALAACTEIMISVRDVAAARAAASELGAIADASGARFLRALASQARGSVLLAEGEARAALADLRVGWMAWQELEAPYDAARVRVLLGLACRALGDHDTAELEFEAAGRVFRRLDARPDIERLAALARSPSRAAPPALTARELQVLKLITSGKTNRAIAHDLAISERTVDRHVANILRKLALSTRSAATAYAYEHRLV
jgi:DNA-binding CsgD family transcriptional regulator